MDALASVDDSLERLESEITKIRQESTFPSPTQVKLH